MRYAVGRAFGPATTTSPSSDRRQADRHALGVMKQIVGVVLLFHRDQASKIVAPIGLRKVQQIEIAIIHIGSAGHVRSHCRVDLCDLRKPRRRVARACPARKILNAILRAGAARKGRGVGGDIRILPP